MERLMTRKELAAYLGLEPNTLAVWKWKGNGPPCIKIGRSVRYRRSEVDRWLWERAGISTAAVTVEQRTEA